MASMESMLRNINRQLEQHARLFGTDSEIYKEFVHSIERSLGKANYKQRNGAVGYSRSIPMEYKYEDVVKANNKAKGKNTAAAKWSKAAYEAQEMNVDMQDMPKYLRISNEVDKNFQIIYDCMKEELGDEFYASDFVKNISPEIFDRSTILHVHKTTDYKTLTEIDNLVLKAKARAEKMKSDIESAARTTRGKKMTRKEGEQFKNRFSGRHSGMKSKDFKMPNKKRKGKK